MNNKATETMEIVRAESVRVARAIEWTDEQRQMIRDTFANGASDMEFAVLMETARVWGLDPFRRQIYFVQRWDSQKQRKVWATQVAIDGMRARAERTGLYAGQDEPEYEHDERKGIVLCKVRVYRKDWTRPIVGVAYFAEYVQRTRDGAVTQFWREKPHVMIAKCAEALGLRKAFPEELAGAYAPEEMGRDESELDTMSGARRLSHEEAMGITAPMAREIAGAIGSEPPDASAPAPTVLDAIRDDLAQHEHVTLEVAAAVYNEHAHALTADTVNEATATCREAAPRVRNAKGIDALVSVAAFKRALEVDRAKRAPTVTPVTPPAPVVTASPAATTEAPLPPALDATDATGPLAALVEFRALVDKVELPGEAVAAWRKYRAALNALPTAAYEGAKVYLTQCVVHVGKFASDAAAREWFRAAVAEADAREKAPKPTTPANDADADAHEDAMERAAIASEPAVSQAAVLAGINQERRSGTEGPRRGQDPVRWFIDRIADPHHGTPQHVAFSFVHWLHVFPTPAQLDAAERATVARLLSFKNTVHGEADALEWIARARAGVRSEQKRSAQ